MHWAIALFAGIFCLSLINNCGPSTGSLLDNYNVTIQQTTVTDAAAGLDLVAVGQLVKNVTDAESFERALNDPAEKVNNLDLDENGKTDYIEVTEYGADNLRGFSLTTQLADAQEQEIATIEIEKNADGYANVQTHGNRQIYGNNHYYHSRISITDMLIVGWLFSGNRPYYSSPWGYGRYPTHYNPYNSRSQSSYKRDISNRVSTSSMQRSKSSSISSKLSSPNASKSATNIKAPLRNPSSSQKSFQTRNPSKTVASGGFGRPKSSSTPSRPSVKFSSGSSSRSGSFFGGK